MANVLNLKQTSDLFLSNKYYIKQFSAEESPFFQRHRALKQGELHIDSFLAIVKWQVKVPCPVLCSRAFIIMGT